MYDFTGSEFGCYVAYPSNRVNDEVYDKDRKGEFEYETGCMSLPGPYQESFFTALM